MPWEDSTRREAQLCIKTGSIHLASHTEYVDGKLATREDSCPLFSFKSSTVSCSSPKSDTRPPFKLFISVSSHSKKSSQHASSKCPLSPVPPHFLTTKLHLLFLTVLASCSTETHSPTLELSVLLLSYSVALLPYWRRVPASLPYTPTLMLPTSLTIIYHINPARGLELTLHQWDGGTDLTFHITWSIRKDVGSSYPPHSHSFLPFCSCVKCPI